MLSGQTVWEWPNTIAIKGMPRFFLSRINNLSKQIHSDKHFSGEWIHVFVKFHMKKLCFGLVFLSTTSDLPFIAKLADKTSFNQSSNHMNKVRSLPLDQSACSPFPQHRNSTSRGTIWYLAEYGLQEVTLLVIIDLSVAFDTIDRSISSGKLGLGFWCRWKSCEVVNGISFSKDLESTN